jgi:hypothetical protein
MDRVLLGLLIAFLVTGCTAQVAPDGSATLPTIAQVPVVETDPVPTNTAIPPATPAPRPTLPPTWTPSPPRYPTDLPDYSLNAQACSTFSPWLQYSDREFVYGDAPNVVWGPVTLEGVTYRIDLIRLDGEILFTEAGLTTNQFRFDPALFSIGQVYAWLVYPFGPDGEQLCLETGVELVARPFAATPPS